MIDQTKQAAAEVPETFTMPITNPDYVKALENFRVKHGFSDLQETVNEMLNVVLALDNNTQSTFKFLRNGETSIEFRDEKGIVLLTLCVKNKRG